jgi:hypothetical protein
MPSASAPAFGNSPGRSRTATVWASLPIPSLFARVAPVSLGIALELQP